ncbi:hypothetical protein AB4Z45_06725 [Paenibacillus sp. MCAF9]|uniref:hypothetical protein n=1 Tax=unclassified Paenibacillus TaxID=185978 RepID=UPI003F9AF03E
MADNLTELQNKSIAILGATSHIAKNIIFELAANNQYNLLLYARSFENMKSYITDISQDRNPLIKCFSLNEFGYHYYDVVINCIGIGDPGKLKEDYHQIFHITEYYDNLVIDYLNNKSRQTLYINLSSGAAYGTEFSEPAGYNTKVNIQVNNLKQQNYYGVAKLNAEAKHRSLENFNIVDLRVFSFFSRFINLNSKFLITEMINSIRQNKIFDTGLNDIIRDYVSPKDFCNLINLCIAKSIVNTAYDVYSLAPVSKFELIEFFHNEFSMQYRIIETSIENNSTGQKSIYFSENKLAEEIDYYPSSTSLESIMEEASKIIYTNG